MTKPESLDLAKKVYKEIYLSICDLNKKHRIFCTLPPSIELDGMIYQAYQCLDQEWLDHTKLGAEQVNRVCQGETKFYIKENDDPTN